MIELRVLGSLDLRDSHGRTIETVIRRSKRLALLVYLGLARPRGFHPRDTLLALFWPESDQEHARNALGQAVHLLRSQLGKDVLISRGSELGVDFGRLSCDAVRFEALLDEGEPAEAMELYRGDLLEGFHVGDIAEFERWLDGERRRLRGRAKDAVSRLASSEDAAGNAAGALGWTRRALSLSPEDETSLRWVIELLDRRGDRAGAVKEYEAFAARLADEYDLRPSPETQALIERVRRREGLAADIGSAEPSDVSKAAEARSEPDGRSKTAGRSWRQRAAYAMGIAVGLGLAVGLLLLGQKSYQPPVADSSGPYVVEDQGRSYMVLPFAVTSADTSLYWLSSGAAHMLTTDLDIWRELRVVDQRRVLSLAQARNMSLKGTVSLSDAMTVARDAGVGRVVLGEVLVHSAIIELVVRVHDVVSGERVGGPIRVRAPAGENVFALIDQIAGQILGLTGYPGMRPDIRAVTTESLRAYQRYNTGLSHLYNYELEEAAADFRAAIEYDSTFAMAYSRLATALGWNIRLTGIRDEIRELVETALMYSDRLSWRERKYVLGQKASHTALAYGELDDYQVAREIFLELITSDSTDAWAWFELGDVEFHDRALVTDSAGGLRPRASVNKAIEAFNRAIELDPLFYISYEHLQLAYARIDEFRRFSDGSVFYVGWRDSLVWVPIVDSGDSARAVEYFGKDSIRRVYLDRALEMVRRWSQASPTASEPRRQLMWYLIRDHAYEEALHQAKHYLRLRADPPPSDLAQIAQLYLKQAIYDTAAVLTDQALAATANRQTDLPSWLAGELANVYVATGQPSSALKFSSGVRPTFPDRAPQLLYRVPDDSASRLLQKIAILGATGVAGPELDLTIDSLRQIWSAPHYDPNEVLELVAWATPRIGNALLFASADQLRAWFTPLDSLSDIWRAHLLLRQDSLGPASERLQRALAAVQEGHQASIAGVYVLANLAAKVDRDSTAVALLARLDTVHYALNRFDPGWGYLSLSYAQRARCYEAMGDTTSAVEFYQRFISAWSRAEPDLQHRVDEARRRIARLKREPETAVTPIGG